MNLADDDTIIIEYMYKNKFWLSKLDDDLLVYNKK